VSGAAINEDIQADADKVTFFLYTDPNKLAVNQGKQLKLKDDSTFQNTGIKPAEPLVILVHGFLQVHSCSFPQDVKDAYIQSGQTHNVITVDYGDLACYGWSQTTSPLCYPSAVDKITTVAKQISDLIHTLVSKGLTTPSKVHIVGVSLGAHVAGIAGKTYKNERGTSLGRVTGLDPAGPLFTGAKGNILAPADASFVDAIYSDMGNLGNTQALAQVNFYPNGGAHPQPGCEGQETLCSHSAAAKLFIQSIKSNSIKGYKCDNYDAFNKGECGLQATHTFGHHAETGKTGKFYLNIQPQGFSGKYSC